jgi:hypothetical protein
MIQPLKQVTIGDKGILLHLTASIRSQQMSSNNAPFSLCYSTTGNNSVGTPMKAGGNTIFANVLLGNENHRAVSLSGRVAPADPGTYFVGLCHQSADNIFVHTGMGFGLLVQ